MGQGCIQCWGGAGDGGGVGDGGMTVETEGGRRRGRRNDGGERSGLGQVSILCDCGSTRTQLDASPRQCFIITCSLCVQSDQSCYKLCCIEQPCVESVHVFQAFWSTQA